MQVYNSFQEMAAGTGAGAQGTMSVFNNLTPSDAQAVVQHITDARGLLKQAIEVAGNDPDDTWSVQYTLEGIMGTLQKAEKFAGDAVRAARTPARGAGISRWQMQCPF
jgi:dihydrodipicolinate synthase/N-acetylneuraminate lyase